MIIEEKNEDKLAHGQLLNDNTLLISILENLNTGVALIDDSGKFLLYNRKFLNLFGLAEESTIKNVNDQNWGEWKVFNENMVLLDVDEHPVRKAALTGRKVENQLVGVRLPSADDVIWMLVSAEPLFNSDGKIEKTICTYSDITTRIEADEALKKSRMDLKSITDNSPDVIARFDRDLRHIFINPYGERVYGKPRKEIIGKTNSDLGMPEENVEMWKSRFEEVFSTGKQVTAEFEFDSPVFGNQHFLSVFVPEFENGSVNSILAITRDITERIHAEQEIQKKNEELTRFIYTVSHDLKSPLVTIKSFTSYLRDDIAINNKEAQESDIKYILNAADKMNLLLDELLELSRIGKKGETKTKVSLAEVSGQAIDLVAGRISQKNVSVSVAAPDVMLFGNKQRLIQLYQNLIDNSVKFMGNQPSPSIEIGAIADKGKEEINLYVKDNGSGIDPKYQHKVFGLFEKLETGTEGTGIGLALIKRIVEVHNGSIWFVSEGNGKGTTFFFTLEGTSLKSS
jgi:PAS domain S-box-containing protein